MFAQNRTKTILVAAALCVVPLWADGGPNHRVRNQHFGVSGGNVQDISRRYCCSGTLGALVYANGTPYILSNNHVLARSDQAVAGEDISQPGLIDNACRPGTLVGDFTVAPTLGSNVDAALALLRPGTMDSTGFIEDIGVPSGTVRTATVGLAVAKSGRTTGFTRGAVSALNASVRVQYQRGCGTGTLFTVSYTNQIVISSSTFSAGGDSGSLIVTDNSLHQPVGLLFAGSSTATIANPIGEVLTRLSGALGQTVTFAGGAASAAATLIAPPAPSESLVSQANEAARTHGRDWMKNEEVVGVGIGAADDNPYEAVVVVFVDRTRGRMPDLPDQANGFRVKRILTDPFVARVCCDKCR